MTEAAIDNDVLFKACCYGILKPLLAAMPTISEVPAVLGTARFVVPGLMRKRPPVRLEQAQAELTEALAEFETLEPSDAEAQLAAQLEYEAQQRGLALQGGECLLVAIGAARGLHWVLTGDRAAIKALGKLHSEASPLTRGLERKIVCLEQAVCELASQIGASKVRAAICAERAVDTALRLCFSCGSPEVTEVSWFEGLHSHVRSTAVDAAGLLLPVPETLLA